MTYGAVDTVLVILHSNLGWCQWAVTPVTPQDGQTFSLHLSDGETGSEVLSTTLHKVPIR